jgi:hypothetical protein
VLLVLLLVFLLFGWQKRLLSLHLCHMGLPWLWPLPHDVIWALHALSRPVIWALHALYRSLRSSSSSSSLHGLHCSKQGRCCCIVWLLLLLLLLLLLM